MRFSPQPVEPSSAAEWLKRDLVRFEPGGGFRIAEQVADLANRCGKPSARRFPRADRLDHSGAMAGPYVPLRIFSSYTMLEGAIEPKAIAKQAKQARFSGRRSDRPQRPLRGHGVHRRLPGGGGAADRRDDACGGPAGGWRRSPAGARLARPLRPERQRLRQSVHARLGRASRPPGRGAGPCQPRSAGGPKRRPDRADGRRGRGAGAAARRGAGERRGERF